MVVKNKISKKKVKKISLRKSRRKTSKKSKKKSRKVSKKKIKQNLKKSYRKKKIRRSSTKKKKVKKVKKVRVINKKKLKKLRVSRVKSKRKRGLRVYTKKRRQKGAAALSASTIVNEFWIAQDASAEIAGSRLLDYEVAFSIQLLDLYYGDILHSVTKPTQFGNPNGSNPNGSNPNGSNPDASPAIFTNTTPPVLRLLALQTYIRYFDPVHFNNETFNQRWLFIVLFDYLLDHIHDFAKGPRNIKTLIHSDILVDKLKKRRPETDQVFVFGLPYIDNFLKSLEARGIQTPDSSSITWEIIYVFPGIDVFHEKCFKTIMIPNENDVLNFIINQVCEGDMSVEQIDSKNILVGRHSLGTNLTKLGGEGVKSFIKNFIKTINNQYFSKLEPFKDYIIKDESINIGGLLGLFTRAIKIPIRKGGVLQEVFPNVIDPGSGSLSNVIAQMKIEGLGLNSVTTSIKSVRASPHTQGIPYQFITLRSYKPITLSYIKIEIQPKNSTEIIRVYYKDGNILLPLGILDDSALSVDNVFVAYDYYIKLVAGDEDPTNARSGKGSLGMLYNLVWNLFYKNEPENVVIAILLDLKKGGDWLQVDFATMNNTGFETEDRECVAYAILVNCAVVFRYNYSSNGLLGAIKKIFTKIKERATVGAQVGGMVMAQRQPQSDPDWYEKPSPTARRELSFDSAQSLSPVEILVNELVNELDNFSTGEIEYYGDYSDLIEELYDDDAMEQIRDYVLENIADIERDPDFGLTKLEQILLPWINEKRLEFPDLLQNQKGGLRLEGITERSETYMKSVYKILNNLINPSSFGSGLQIMCPYTRMELIVTQELINTLGEIPKKIKLLEPGMGDFLTNIYHYMNELINIVVAEMRRGVDDYAHEDIEKEYRRIIKIYETLKKIVSNIKSFTDLDEQQRRDAEQYLQHLQQAPPPPPPTLKGFLKTFKPFHKTALKNKKIIRKIMEDYEKLERILTPNGYTIGNLEHLKELQGKSADTLTLNFRQGIDGLELKNNTYITTLQGIQQEVGRQQRAAYKKIERLNESIIQEATIDIMHGEEQRFVGRGSAPGRSEQKIIKAYMLALKQFPVGFEPSYGVAEQTWINANFPNVAVHASKAAIKSVLQKIPSFKKYKFAATARAAGSTKVRDGFNELVLVKKEIKKIEKIAKFIES